MYTIHIILFVCLFVAAGNSWDLDHFGISENYYVSSIAIYRTRAFLALPRSVCHNNVDNPTVVEVPWIGSFKQATNIKPFRSKILEFQKWGDCKNIQDAVSLNVEPKKSKLWILDKGNEFCAPKIISSNVIYNSVSHIKELNDVPKANLNVIVIDCHQGACKMYIGNAGDNTILVFSLESLKLWTVQLREMNNMPVSVSADFLAISKSDPVLYITGKHSLDLFSINLDVFRRIEEQPYESMDETGIITIEVNVTRIGQKMGISTGLETDFGKGLSYYMVRDFVVVRWLIGFPMAAEYHSVLVQSYEELPHVSQLFTDPQFGLWALVNPVSLDECQGVNNTTNQNVAALESRVVKILKYNKFLNGIF